MEALGFPICLLVHQPLQHLVYGICNASLGDQLVSPTQEAGADCPELLVRNRKIHFLFTLEHHKSLLMFQVYPDHDKAANMQIRYVMACR